MDVEDTKLLRIVCPSCGRRSKIEIPTKFTSPGRPLTTVSVPSGHVCDHAFQVFLDQHLSVRGYQVVDLELDLSTGKAKPSEVPDLREVTSLLGLETTIMTFRALTIGHPAYFINVDGESFQTLTKFFGSVMAGDDPGLFEVTPDNREKLVNALTGRDRSVLVVDFPTKLVLALPFRGETYEEEVALFRRALLHEDPVDQLKYLRGQKEEILTIAEILRDLLRDFGSVKKQRDLKSLKKRLESRIKLTLSDDLFYLVLDVLDVRHGVHVWDRPLPFSERIGTLLDGF
ncbi:MAG: hypothetical protein Kow0069_12440 [Promethearchaeota archaeon]